MSDGFDPTTFHLDGDGAIATVAMLWGLDPDEPSAWQLEHIGASTGIAVENLAGVLFAPTRGLVSGPAAEVRVYPVVDPYCSPLLVCVATDSGPMLSAGVEDFDQLLDPAVGASPRRLMAAMQRLLDLAGEVYREGRAAAAEPASRPAWHMPPARLRGAAMGSATVAGAQIP